MNDSVFFRQKGLDDFITALLRPEDVISSSEYWGHQVRYHMQSFAISISENLYNEPKILEFWQHYIPITSRRYAIEKGEKTLSSVLINLARTSYVIYNLADFYLAIQQEKKDLSLPLKILPQRYRHMIDSSDQVTFNVFENKEQLTDLLNRTSAIHLGVFLFPHYLNMPFFKKDMVFRKRQEFWEADTLIRPLLTQDEYSEFMTIIRQKGNRYEMGFKRKLKLVYVRNIFFFRTRSKTEEYIQ